MYVGVGIPHAVPIIAKDMLIVIGEKEEIYIDTKRWIQMQLLHTW